MGHRDGRDDGECGPPPRPPQGLSCALSGVRSPDAYQTPQGRTVAAAVHGPQIVRSPDDQQMSFDAGGSTQ